MRKSLRFVTLGGILALSIPAFLALSQNVKKVDAYSTSSLPTTIDLNDTSAANIRSYYSSLNNLSTSERQGNNLLKNLKTILKNGQKYYSYDSGNAIWQIYEIADRDWSKSPASSTTYGTYNSSTNKITNYTYGTSSSSSKNNPYIHALYINRNVVNQVTAWDDHQQTQWGINREHVWPKAEGFEASGAGGARGDPMHLMAGNGYANNIHSNYYYGYVNTSSSYTNCGSKFSNVSGNLLGKSKTLGGSTNVFEPQDCDKGDIARAIFYMVARYNYLSKSDSDGIDSNNPNLALTQSLDDWASSGYSSTTSTKGYMGIMTDLLAWHHADPVDEYEIHRNNLLYTNYTNNRNPFIDFPEWADFIWGSVNYSGTTYVSNDTTPTGYATPSSDTINGYNSGGSTVSVTGVTLSPNSTSVQAGSDVTLTATVAPSNATNQTVTWTSSDSSIATVSDGIVTGVAEGNATITVRTNDGGYTATCSVTVTPGSTPTPGGEDTDEGSVTAVSGALEGWTASGTGSAYADGSVKFDTAGDNVYKTDIFTASVASGMTSLSVTINGKINGTPTTANSYKVEALDSSGNVLASDVKTGASIYISNDYQDATFTISSGLTGCTGFRVTYVTKGGGNWGVKSISWVATYSSGSSEPTLSSIVVKTAPTKLTYTAGDDFAPAGLVITATYSDSTTADIEYAGHEDEFEFDPADDLQTSDVSVTISYGGKTCAQAITVNASKSLTSITLNTDNVKKTFTVGETFQHDNLVVTAHFSDSSSDVVSSSANVSTPDMSTTGQKTVTVSFTYQLTTETATYKISVIQQTGGTTVNLSIGEYGSAHNWTNGTKYTSITIDEVIGATVSGGSNTGKYYNNVTPNEWRLYQSESATITISAEDDYVIDVVIITYNVQNTGILVDSNENDVESDDPQTVSAQSVTFSVTNSGTATNGQVRVTNISVTYHSASATPMTGIVATVERTFTVGETISTSDISVRGDNGQVVTGFSFANNGYQFTYADASSGGAATNKTFTNSVTYSSFTCSLTVSVSRAAYVTPTGNTISLTSSQVFSGIGGGNTNLKSGTLNYGGATYQYYKSYYYTGGSALSFGNASDQTGYLKNNTEFESGISNVTVTSSGRAVNIRYSTDGSTWVLKANADVSKNNYKYLKVDCIGKTGSNYSNITAISIELKPIETAVNVANYVMYEDTANQCVTKFATASNYFGNMSSSERVTFMTSNDYVIATARERFEAWARYHGKTISYENSDYTIKNASPISVIFGNGATNNSQTLLIVIVSSLLGVSLIGGYIFLRKRKEQ